MAAGLFVAGPVAPGAGGAQGFPDGRQWLTVGVADFGADARLQWASRGAVMAEALNVRDPAKVGRPRRAPRLLLGPVWGASPAGRLSVLFVFDIRIWSPTLRLVAPSPLPHARRRPPDALWAQVTHAYLRIIRDANETFRAFFRQDEEKAWVPFAPAVHLALGNVTVGVYAAHCEPPRRDALARRGVGRVRLSPLARRRGARAHHGRRGRLRARH